MCVGAVCLGEQSASRLCVRVWSVWLFPCQLHESVGFLVNRDFGNPRQLRFLCGCNAGGLFGVSFFGAFHLSGSPFDRVMSEMGNMLPLTAVACVFMVAVLLSGKG